MWSILELLLTLLGCLFIVKYLKIKWAARSLPPGPTPLPVIGNLWTLRFGLRPDTLRQLVKLYGNIYTLWLGHTPLVMLNGCRTVRDALVSHSEELSGRPVASFMKDISNGRGIGVTNGHTWKQQRRFGLMTLRNLGLGKLGLESRIWEEAQSLVESFAAENGKPMDPSYIIIHAVANVMSAVVFGHRFSIDDLTFQKLVACNNTLLESMSSKWGIMYDAFPWLMRHIPGPHQEAFVKKEYIENVIRKEIRIHQENRSPEEPQDVIDHYLAQIIKTKSEPGSTFDEANMIQVVIDFFSAGTETTATTMQWALLYMVAYPDVQEKVQKELDSVLEGSQLVYYEDRKRLPYTNAVIHEIQRYGNIAAVGVPRCSTKNVTLNGFSLEKDTMILPNLDSVLHDPQHWETPNQFSPNHFLDKEGNFLMNEAFLPFSAGHRVCLGEQLARIELLLFFTSLLRAFSFQLPQGVTEVNLKYVFKMTLVPHPYKICAIRR
ncbi:cytochrome P450 2J4-like [Ascaphus truei]|uniref:cytochrome P450 2J4-like n=1 Tax=Ascaphus truei TaxID=8439 RepID=UPI003F5A9A09